MKPTLDYIGKNGKSLDLFEWEFEAKCSNMVGFRGLRGREPRGLANISRNRSTWNLTAPIYMNNNKQ